MRGRVRAAPNGLPRIGHTVSVDARSVLVPKHSGSRATGSIQRPRRVQPLAGAEAGPLRWAVERAAELRRPFPALEAGAARLRIVAVVEEVVPRPMVGAEAGPHTAEEGDLRAMGARAQQRVAEEAARGSRTKAEAEAESARQLAVEGAGARPRAGARRSSSSPPTPRRRRMRLRDRSFEPWTASRASSRTDDVRWGVPTEAALNSGFPTKGRRNRTGGTRCPPSRSSDQRQARCALLHAPRGPMLRYKVEPRCALEGHLHVARGWADAGHAGPIATLLLLLFALPSPVADMAAPARHTPAFRTSSSPIRGNRAPDA